jgi:hypothetical protein
VCMIMVFTPSLADRFTENDISSHSLVRRAGLPCGHPFAVHRL